VSPNSHAKAMSGLREELEAKLNVTKEELAMKIQQLEIANRYSTRAEADVGAAILEDSESGILKKLVVEPSAEIPIDLSATLLECKVGATHEDDVINAPLATFLQRLLEVLETRLQTVDCTKSSPLVDARGRHHRGDGLILPVDEDLAWPYALTFLEGKHGLTGQDLKIVVGQAQRRGEALREQQPWRERIDVVFHCLSRVGFLRLARADLDLRPCVSDTYDFISLSDGGQLNLGVGFWMFKTLLDERFGWTPCPVSLDLASHLDLSKYAAAHLVCGRSASKAVFRLEARTSETETVVFKVMENQDRVAREHEVIRRLSAVPGILTVSELLRASVVSGAIMKEWVGFTMPFCTQLTPAQASPRAFASYATTLFEASQQGVQHNDVSLDNLVACGDHYYVIDWEHATTSPSATVSVGKMMFASKKALVRHPVKQTRTIVDDLESLFFVAVCCLLQQQLEWPRIREPTAMARKRDQECHLERIDSRGMFLKDSPGHWQHYLDNIRRCIVETRRNTTNTPEQLLEAWKSIPVD
jgi:hypothetical protein